MPASSCLGASRVVAGIIPTRTTTNEAPMSDQNPYGQDPRQNPSPQHEGQPGPYGQPGQQQPHYQQGAYGQPTPFGAGTYTSAPSAFQQLGIGSPANPGSYASWGKRVGAYLLDQLWLALLSIPCLIGLVLILTDIEEKPFAAEDELALQWKDGAPALGFALFAAGIVLPLVFALWNWGWRQGRRGSTVGKSMLHIKVVNETTGHPVGFGMSLLRQIVHTLDGSLLGLGYLWPLWDAKRQTFADKIMTTVVVPSSTPPVPLPGQHPYGYAAAPYGQAPYGQAPYGQAPQDQNPPTHSGY